MRGIPPHELFQCPSRESGHWSRSRDGGYMRQAMAVPERQPSLHEKKPENLNTIGIILFQKQAIGLDFSIPLFFSAPLPFTERQTARPSALIGSLRQTAPKLNREV